MSNIFRNLFAPTTADGETFHFGYKVLMTLANAAFGAIVAGVAASVILGAIAVPIGISVSTIALGAAAFCGAFRAFGGEDGGYFARCFVGGTAGFALATTIGGVLLGSDLSSAGFGVFIAALLGSLPAAAVALDINERNSRDRFSERCYSKAGPDRNTHHTLGTALRDVLLHINPRYI